jgi:hypothetical protein
MIGRVLIVAFFLAATPLLLAQTTRPTSLPTDQRIPRSQLDSIYRTELGRLYNSADSEKLYRAQELIERYFVEPPARKDIVRSLELLSLNPGIIGRMTRIRMAWPQLATGIYYINEKMGPHDVRYYLGIPRGYDRAKPWPLVIKLPSADVFVTDPRPDAIQVTHIYSEWMTDELKRHPDAVLIMPLLNLDELWGPSYTGTNSVIQPMLHAANHLNIDPARVYIVGHGMSADAAWNLSLHYMTYFAAFNALAGGAAQDWQRLRLMNLRNVLPVVWHDADDETMNVGGIRQLVGTLRTQKIDVEYQETRNVGHFPTDEIAEQGYQKMRGRVRSLYPKQVSLQSNRPDTMCNRNDWVQVYQPISEVSERKIYFSQGKGSMTLLAPAWMIDATVSNNTIAISTRNVASIRFYLNDQMVELSRPVSVVQNRRTLFQAILKPDIGEMLKDQLFLGRGWRYCSAIIDVDFAVPARPAPTTTSTTRPRSAAPDDAVP